MKDCIVMIAMIFMAVTIGVYGTKYIDEKNAGKNLPQAWVLHDECSPKYQIIGYSPEQMDLLWSERDRGVHERIVRNRPNTIQMVKGNIILKRESIRR